MYDKCFLAIRVAHNGTAEARLCSTREEAETNLYEVAMTLYAHEHATLKSAKNYADIAAVVSKQTGLPFKIKIIETSIGGKWFNIK